MYLENKVESESVKHLFNDIIDLSGLKGHNYALYEIMAEESKLNVRTVARYASSEVNFIPERFIKYMEKLKERLSSGEKLVSKEERLYSNPGGIKEAYKKVRKTYDIEEEYLTNLIVDCCSIKKENLLAKIEDNQTKRVRSKKIIDFLNELVQRKTMFEYSLSRNYSIGNLIYQETKGFGRVIEKTGKNRITVEFKYKPGHSETVELLERYVEDLFDNTRKGDNIMMMVSSTVNR